MDSLKLSKLDLEKILSHSFDYNSEKLIHLHNILYSSKQYILSGEFDEYLNNLLDMSKTAIKKRTKTDKLSGYQQRQKKLLYSYKFHIQSRISEISKNSSELKDAFYTLQFLVKKEQVCDYYSYVKLSQMAHKIGMDTNDPLWIKKANHYLSKVQQTTPKTKFEQKLSEQVQLLIMDSKESYDRNIEQEPRVDEFEFNASLT